MAALELALRFPGSQRPPERIAAQLPDGDPPAVLRIPLEVDGRACVGVFVLVDADMMPTYELQEWIPRPD